MRWLTGLWIFGVLASCASAPRTSSEAKRWLENKYPLKTTQKAELESDFGSAEWCKETDEGKETCKYYREYPTVSIGTGFEKRTFTPFDDVRAEFDSKGQLQSIEATAVR